MFLRADKPRTLTKKAYHTQHRAIGHVQYAASLRADTPSPRQGASGTISEPQAAKWKLPSP
ncbi:MAG: hypothetical protein K2J04_09105 [Lachnospiraceae bacterium]|nr:hypothetical protein [Lachnospiraceae bacterium]